MNFSTKFEISLAWMSEVLVHSFDRFPLIVAVHVIQIAEKDHAFQDFHDLLVVVFPLPILNLHEVMSGFGIDHINTLAKNGDHVFVGVNDGLGSLHGPFAKEARNI